jgi:uncharacterized protein (UPF0264 family)
MKLLVSVRSAEEAEIALIGGADIIDAKDPSVGALGAVRLDVLSDIHRVLAGCPLSAALGDGTDAATVGRLASQFVARGAQVVKVGFAGISSEARASELMSAAVSATRTTNDDAGVVAVAYADSEVVGSIDPNRLLEIAARSGATGVLIDTGDKSGPGLRSLWTDTELADWVSRAHECVQFAAIAGKLDARDLADVIECGADIVGVRGAACVGGRNGRISAELVRRLRASVIPTAGTSHSALPG